jgi:hypothetical protein
LVDVHWQEILRERGRAMIKERTLAAPFPFERPPREIQLMILRYVVVADSAIPYGRVVGYCSARTNGAAPRISWPGCCGRCRRYVSWEVCRCSLDSYFSSGCTCPILDDGIFLVSKQVRRDAIDIFFQSNESLFLRLPTPVLGDLCNLLGKDSWIWRVKMVYVDTWWPPRDVTRAFRDVLPLLHRLQEHSKCEITYSFSAFNRSEAKQMSRLRDFYGAYEESGLDPSRIWVPKKIQTLPYVPVCLDTRGIYTTLTI